jgi:hypothetical protein
MKVLLKFAGKKFSPLPFRQGLKTQSRIAPGLMAASLSAGIYPRNFSQNSKNEKNTTSQTLEMKEKNDFLWGKRETKSEKQKKEEEKKEEDEYTGPDLELKENLDFKIEHITHQWVVSVMELFIKKKLLKRALVRALIKKAHHLFDKQPSLINLHIKE